MILLKDCKCIVCDNQATVTATNTWDTHKCKKCYTHYEANFLKISHMQTSITYVDQIKEVYKSYIAVYDGKELKIYSHTTSSEPYMKMTYDGQVITYFIAPILINDDVGLLKNSINHFKKNIGEYNLNAVRNKIGKFNTLKAFT